GRFRAWAAMGTADRMAKSSNDAHMVRRDRLLIGGLITEHYRLIGFTITPRCVRPFIFTTTGTSNRRRRTNVVSSTAGCSASQSQSTKPSPTSGFTVKYPTFDAVRF